MGGALWILTGTLLHRDQRVLQNGFVAKGAIVYAWADERTQNIENQPVTA